VHVNYLSIIFLKAYFTCASRTSDVATATGLAEGAKMLRTAWVPFIFTFEL
jgi:hypothetical protein